MQGGRSVGWDGEELAGLLEGAEDWGLGVF